MTTLPPESNDNLGAASHENLPQEPPVQQTPPVDPQVGGPAPDASDVPLEPRPDFAPPQQPGYSQPAGGAADAYQQPQQSQQPGYAPPAGGYQQQPGYQQQQQPGYQQPQSDPVSTVTLNYWLSVFFSWIPALIFWMIEKDKGNPQATAYHTANLNFSLLRVGVGVVIMIFAWIPIIGWIIGGLLGIVSLGLFVLHIIAAVSAGENYKRGAAPGFMFNISIIK